jgi:hypothetical protein
MFESLMLESRVHAPSPHYRHQLETVRATVTRCWANRVGTSTVLAFLTDRSGESNA